MCWLFVLLGALLPPLQSPDSTEPTLEKECRDILLRAREKRPDKYMVRSRSCDTTRTKREYDLFHAWLQKNLTSEELEKHLPQINQLVLENVKGHEIDAGTFVWVEGSTIHSIVTTDLGVPKWYEFWDLEERLSATIHGLSEDKKSAWVHPLVENERALDYWYAQAGNSLVEIFKFLSFNRPQGQLEIVEGENYLHYTWRKSDDPYRFPIYLPMNPLFFAVAGKCEIRLEKRSSKFGPRYYVEVFQWAKDGSLVRQAVWDGICEEKPYSTWRMEDYLPGIGQYSEWEHNLTVLQKELVQFTKPDLQTFKGIEVSDYRLGEDKQVFYKFDTKFPTRAGLLEIVQKQWEENSNQ